MQLAITTTLFTNVHLFIALSVTFAIAGILASSDLKAKLAAWIKRTYLTIKNAFNQHIITVYGFS